MGERVSKHRLRRGARLPGEVNERLISRGRCEHRRYRACVCRQRCSAQRVQGGRAHTGLGSNEKIGQSTCSPQESFGNYSLR
jgi:hypothetical protein